MPAGRRVCRTVPCPQPDRAYGRLRVLGLVEPVRSRGDADEEPPAVHRGRGSLSRSSCPNSPGPPAALPADRGLLDAPSFSMTTLPRHGTLSSAFCQAGKSGQCLVTWGLGRNALSPSFLQETTFPLHSRGAGYSHKRGSICRAWDLGPPRIPIWPASAS